jgi:hypothetical protein
MEILRVGNGYRIRLAGANTESGKDIILDEVIEDDLLDDLKSGEELLHRVMEHFFFYGSPDDPERLNIVREPGEEYIEPKKIGKKNGTATL